MAAPDDAIDPHVSTRQRALATASQRAASLLKGFETLPDGSIPISPDQFVQALKEADLITKIGDSYELGAALGKLNLSEPATVGSDARRIVEEHLDQAEELLAACRELAAFQPQEPAGELRTLAGETGAYGAELVVALIATLTAPNYGEAISARDRVKKLWAEFPFGERLRSALAKLEPWGAPDLDARVALALGREGTFTDGGGAVDPSLVFLAFAEDDSPYEALAERAWRYLTPHTGSKSSMNAEPGASAALIGPLVMLAASERPLRAHNTTRLMFEAAKGAYDVDPDAVMELDRRASEEAPLTFAAQARVERAFKDLAEDLADEDALDRMLRSYRQLAETTYRTIGWIALGLEAIRNHAGLPPEDHPPMLRELQQRLAAGGDLAQAIASGIDVELRNAEAHVQYRWVAEREVVRDFRTGQEWTVDQLDSILHELIGSIVGANAGYLCFIVAMDIAVEAPTWCDDAGASEMSELVAGMAFGAKGYEVIRVADRGATVVIQSQPELDRAGLLPALAGLVPFTKDAEVFTVEDDTGVRLAMVKGESIRRAVSGPAVFKDLATISTVYESAVNTGMDAHQAGSEFLAMAGKVVAVTGMEDLVERELAPSAFRDLDERLGFLITLVKSPVEIEIEDAATFGIRLGRIRRSARRASRGNQSALKTMLKELGELADLADQLGLAWPPEHQAAR